MDKDQIKREFHEFIDNASEETLREFLNYMKARRKERAKIDSQIQRIIKDKDESTD